LTGGLPALLWAALIFQLVFTSPPAAAAPPDRRVWLKAGAASTSFPLEGDVRPLLKGDPVVLLSRDPEGALRLTPTGREGVASLFLRNERHFECWELRLTGDGDHPLVEIADDPEAIQKAKTLCGAFAIDREDKLEAQLNGDACLVAIAPLTATRLRSEVRLSFDEQGLRAQLDRSSRALESAGFVLAKTPLRRRSGLDAPDTQLRLAFLGATLIVRGEVENASRLDELMSLLFEASVGPFNIDWSGVILKQAGGSPKKPARP